MVLSVLAGKDMKGALTALEAVAHERQQRVVLLLPRAEKGADMPVATEHRAGKGNRCRGRVHGVFLPWFSCPAWRSLVAVSFCTGVLSEQILPEANDTPLTPE